VTSALCDSFVYRHAVTGATPTPLRQALAGFQRELDTVRRQLEQLS
jgi:hypothetical protein